MVKEYLFEHAKRPREGMERIGKFVLREYECQDRRCFHRGLNSDDIPVTVSGGDGVGHSALIPSWRRWF